MAIYDPENRRMAGIEHKIDCHDAPIEIVALADLHIGDKNIDSKAIMDVIHGIRDTENRYCVLVGDLMNTAIMGSKSDAYGETMSPMEALQVCVEMLKPIRDKIMAIVPGNHEERISRAVGVDMTRLLALQLGLEELFSDTTALVFIRMGHNWRCQPITYTLYISHGTGGGRRPGGKLNALADLAQVIDADCFICGHTHLPASFRQDSYRINSSSTCAVRHEQLFVNTASAISYNGYGRRGGFKPMSNQYPIITLYNDTHHMTATV